MDTFSLNFLKNFITSDFWMVSLFTFLRWTAVMVASTILIHWVFRKTLKSVSDEGKLRLAFILPPAVAIAIILGFNFSLFPLAIYCILGGSFAGILVETWRVYGLVEGNSKPTKEEREFVESYHMKIKTKHRLYASIKRGFDLVFAIMLLALLSPIYLVAAIAVWINDPGPIIIAKHAVGYKGKEFREYKMRSMIKQAEKYTGAIQLQKNDPRLIWAGKIIRASHIDEFPQLFNIIKGNMSFVGPRPEKVVRVTNFLKEVPNYAMRHSVTPGITGWAQIHHTYYTPPALKLKYDMHYINHQSFFLDIYVAFSTIPSTIREILRASSGNTKERPQKIKKMEKETQSKLRWHKIKRLQQIKEKTLNH